jgi:hypothetical protein
MTPESDPTGWIPTIVTGLGLGTTTIGALVIKTATRQARIEQEVKDMRKRNDSDHEILRDGLSRIVKHLTHTDL